MAGDGFGNEVGCFQNEKVSDTIEAVDPAFAGRSDDSFGDGPIARVGRGLVLGLGASSRREDQIDRCIDSTSP